jgi:hypothetical protein
VIRGAAGLLVALALAVPAASATAAGFGIVPGSLTIKTLNGEGHPDNRAGAHPDQLSIDFELRSEGTGPRDIVFDLSPGLAGNARAVPVCPRPILEEGSCPKNTQVGVVKQDLPGADEPLQEPLFNVASAPEEVFTIGTKPLWKILFAGNLRPDDHGLTIGSHDLTQLPTSTGHVELWGVPANHQAEGSKASPRRPFLTTPTKCGPISVTFHTRSWEKGASWLSDTAESAPLEGCQSLPFEPHAEFALSNPIADAPTGVQMDLLLPADEDPDGVVDSQIKAVDVEMPEGMSLSPSGADGRSACSDAELDLGGPAVSSCPPTSKVGTVTVEAPQVGKTLSGSVYIGQEHPGDRFRLFVVAANSAMKIKLVGSLRPDPRSGRLEVTLADLPQLPLTHMTLSLDGGPRALLTTPLSCGSSTAAVTFEPYGGSPSSKTSIPVSIGGNPFGSGCAGTLPFAPGLVAGSSKLGAGDPTSFSMTLTRQDGEQSPDHFSVTLPPGLAAALGTVETCPASGAASGACPPGSRIGSAVVEVGSGPDPAALSGDAYLTGRYRRAPFGMTMVFHSVIGPFDLGSLVVRAAVQMDRRTGQVTVDADSLPQSLEGISIRFRTLGIDLDRPGFLFNPTSCAPSSVNAAFHAREGAAATAASAFSLKGCDALGFRPAFSMALGGRSQLRDQGRPQLRLSVRLPRGDTNLRTIDLPFPRPLKLNSSGLREICTQRDAIYGACPVSARVGSGSARSPLLSKPLEGSVYVVQPPGDGFPDLWINLEGMGLELALRSEVSQRHGRLVTKFVGLPDVPLSKFTMQLRGGDDGILSLRKGFCARGRASRLVSQVAVEGQNGAYRRVRVPVSAKGGCRGSSGQTTSRADSRSARAGR